MPNATALSAARQRPCSAALPCGGCSLMSWCPDVAPPALAARHSEHAEARGRRLLFRPLCAAAGARGWDAHGPPAHRPTSPFVNIILPTALSLMLCNMNRICLSVAVLPMSAEFNWPVTMQGVVQSAFLWGYMATQLIGGALADKYGGRLVMAAGVAWLSVAALLLPAIMTPSLIATGLTTPAVLLSRCLVGCGEGVALPSMNNLVATHVDPRAQARALGLAFAGFHCGNLLGLALSPMLLTAYGWRGLFLIFGALGLPMLLLWLRVVPKPPAAKPAGAAGGGGSQAAEPEPQPTRSVSAADLMSKPAIWAIIIVTIVNNWGYFIYLNWMPSYFNKVLGMDLRAASLTAFLPWLVMPVGSSLSGVLADALIARGVNVTTVRKAVQTVAFVVPAAALMVLSQPGISPTGAVACMTIALGTTSLGLAGYVANMLDVAPRHAGKLYGVCATFGSLSGIVGTTAVGFIVESTSSFTPVFQLTACMYIFGAAVWNVGCRGERVVD